MAFNCNLEYRCVKCNVPHNPGECPRTGTTDAQPYCVNCKQFGHPASYRGCPKLAEIKRSIEIRKEQIQVGKENKRKLVNKLVNPDISFSAIVSNSSSTNTPKPQPHTRPQTNPNTTPHTSLLEEIKNIISVTIKTQISQLTESIQANTNRINIIVDALEIDI